jgi:hypothetical protein
MTCAVITATRIRAMEFVWFGKKAIRLADRVPHGATTAEAFGSIVAAAPILPSGDNPWCDPHTKDD